MKRGIGLEQLLPRGNPPSVVEIALLESIRSFIARAAFVLNRHYDLSNLGVGLHVAVRFDNI